MPTSVQLGDVLNSSLTEWRQFHRDHVAPMFLLFSPTAVRDCCTWLLHTRTGHVICVQSSDPGMLMPGIALIDDRPPLFGTHGLVLPSLAHKPVVMDRVAHEKRHIIMRLVLATIESGPATTSGFTWNEVVFLLGRMIAAWAEPGLLRPTAGRDQPTMSDLVMLSLTPCAQLSLLLCDEAGVSVCWDQLVNKDQPPWQFLTSERLMVPCHIAEIMRTYTDSKLAAEMVVDGRTAGAIDTSHWNRLLTPLDTNWPLLVTPESAAFAPVLIAASLTNRWAMPADEVEVSVPDIELDDMCGEIMDQCLSLASIGKDAQGRVLLTQSELGSALGLCMQSGTISQSLSVLLGKMLSTKDALDCVTVGLVWYLTGRSCDTGLIVGGRLLRAGNKVLRAPITVGGELYCDTPLVFAMRDALVRAKESEAWNSEHVVAGREDMQLLVISEAAVVQSGPSPLLQQHIDALSGRIRSLDVQARLQGVAQLCVSKVLEVLMTPGRQNFSIQVAARSTSTRITALIVGLKAIVPPEFPCAAQLPLLSLLASRTDTSSTQALSHLYARFRVSLLEDYIATAIPMRRLKVKRDTKSLTMFMRTMPDSEQALRRMSHLLPRCGFAWTSDEGGKPVIHIMECVWSRTAATEINRIQIRYEALRQRFSSEGMAWPVALTVIGVSSSAASWEAGLSRACVASGSVAHDLPFSKAKLESVMRLCAEIQTECINLLPILMQDFVSDHIATVHDSGLRRPPDPPNAAGAEEPGGVSGSVDQRLHGLDIGGTNSAEPDLFLERALFMGADSLAKGCSTVTGPALKGPSKPSPNHGAGSEHPP
jgi:hypothetical protein